MRCCEDQGLMAGVLKGRRRGGLASAPLWLPSLFGDEHGLSMARPPGLSREHCADQQGACGHITVSLLTPEKEDFGVLGCYQDRVMGFSGPATVTFCGLWASLLPVWWSPLEPSPPVPSSELVRPPASWPQTQAGASSLSACSQTSHAHLAGLVGPAL